MASATHGGGVVFRLGDSGPLYLLVEASRSKGRWVLPKGGIDRRESAEQAAVREVAEEAVVQARVVQALGRARLQKGGDRIQVEFFLMEYVRDAKPFESRDVRWCRFEKAIEALDDTEAIRLLRRANELVSVALPPPRPDGAAARAARAVVATVPLGLLAILWDEPERSERTTLDQLTHDLAEKLKLAIRQHGRVPDILHDIVCLRMNRSRFDGRLRLAWRV